MGPDPMWWLNHLTGRLDNRRARLALLRRYLEADAPLPDGAENCRDAYIGFQKKARSNYAENITDAVCDRMTVSQFRVGDNAEDDNAARKIWKANKLGIWSADVHRDMVGLSAGYAAVQPGDNGPEVIQMRPEQAIVESDPARPDKRRAALLVYRDFLYDVDFAYLHLPGRVFRFVRDSYGGKTERERRLPLTNVSGGWFLDSTFSDDTGRPTGLTRIPVVAFINRGELGEFETHLDLLDRINWTILQRLVITAMQAFRQLATKGDLPEVDEAGNPIDYAKIFQPGPGALWQLPEGVDLWESSQTDLTGVLNSVKADLTELSAVTKTPMPALVPEGANQSAEGASVAREGLVFKISDRIERARAAWGEVLSLAIELDTAKVVDVDVDFLPPERQSMAERYDALSKAGTDVPWRSKMTQILQLDGDTVDRMASERAADALFAASFAPPPPPNPGGPTQPPPGTAGQENANGDSQPGDNPNG